jgi:hypothetical protein
MTPSKVLASDTRHRFASLLTIFDRVDQSITPDKSLGVDVRREMKWTPFLGPGAELEIGRSV